MRASILKAIQKCCDKNAGGIFANIVYHRGMLYASDKYVLVQVAWANEDPDMYCHDAMNLDWDAVKAAKPSEDLDVASILVERNVFTPSFFRQFEEPKDKDGGDFTIDPKLLRKVTDVFIAADCPMKVEDWGIKLYLHGYSQTHETAIDAIVMKRR